MFVNIIKSCRNIVAICDSELIGKNFEERDFQLEIKESFFKGKEVSEQEILEIMNGMSKEDAIFNIVGEKSIRIALNEGLIHEDAVKRIHGIPFAMVLI